MAEAFFEPVSDGVWRATEHTAGPWDAGSQHGGPPGALLTRTLEHTDARADSMLARVTFEILGPIPVGELTVTSSVMRPGRSVELLTAELASDGRPCMRANAWRIRTTDTGLDPTPNSATSASPPPVPADADARPVPSNWDRGYIRAIEWRWVEGHFIEPGNATVWTRMGVPLVPDEEPSPLQRVVVVADSGNGASSRLDATAWWFINPELTVHVHRPAVGEWICLDASTVVQPHGVGLATSRLWDTDGMIGRGAQSLLIGRRDATRA